MLLVTTAGVLGLLLAAVGALRLAYPDEFQNVLLRYSPFATTAPVIGEAPNQPAGEDPRALPVFAASAVALSASPRGTGFAPVAALILGRPDQNIAPPLPESTLISVKLPFTANEERRVLIYLPKGYSAGDKGLRYPTLYLLHGSPGMEEDWLRLGKAKESLDAAIDRKVIPPVIAVFPNGNGGFQDDSEYINSPDGRQPNEDFLVHTLVSWIDRKYPTRADSRYRAVGGLSEGGYGAVNLTLKHQDVFGYAIALSGYGTIDQNGASARVIQGSAQAIHDNSPLLYVPELKRHTAKVLIVIGQQDGLFEENQRLARLLEN
jgi:enterochelin esterase-like enzyme